MYVNPEHLSDIKALISTGEVSLSERRETFKRIRGRETKLNDEQLIKAIAATDDDDDDLFCTNVGLVEDEQPKSAA